MENTKNPVVHFCAPRRVDRHALIATTVLTRTYFSAEEIVEDAGIGVTKQDVLDFVQEFKGCFQEFPDLKLGFLLTRLGRAYLGALLEEYFAEWGAHRDEPGARNLPLEFEIPIVLIAAEDMLRRSLSKKKTASKKLDFLDVVKQNIADGKEILLHRTAHLTPDERSLDPRLGLLRCLTQWYELERRAVEKEAEEASKSEG